MITLSEGEHASLALAAAHHFGEAGEIPVGSLMRLGHTAATLAVPLALALASFATAFLAGRWGTEQQPAAQPAVLAFSAPDAHPPAEPRGERPNAALRPVTEFYRVAFGDESGFRRWVQRVMEFTSGLEGVLSDSWDVRPVIFIQLRPPRDASPHAYVSAGARGLAANISGDVRLDAAPVPASELPAGLVMLFGDKADADAYERRAVGNDRA